MRNNDTLDMLIGPIGLKQNMAKREHNILWASGQGSKKAVLDTVTDIRSMKGMIGEVLETTRYLGNWVNDKGSTTANQIDEF